MSLIQGWRCRPVARFVDLLTDGMVVFCLSLNSGRTVQYTHNAQFLRLFGLHGDVNDAHRAGANRLQNKNKKTSRRQEVALGRNEVQQAQETVINGIAVTCGMRLGGACTCNQVNVLVGQNRHLVGKRLSKMHWARFGTCLSILRVHQYVLVRLQAFHRLFEACTCVSRCLCGEYTSSLASKVFVTSKLAASLSRAWLPQPIDSASRAKGTKGGSWAALGTKH